jgi:NAD-dependent SIR2 family protein deacetylase
MFLSLIVFFVFRLISIYVDIVFFGENLPKRFNECALVVSENDVELLKKNEMILCNRTFLNVIFFLSWIRLLK